MNNALDHGASQKARQRILAWLAASATLIAPSLCMAAPELPQGYTVKSGAVKITSNATDMTIRQTSSTAVIDWSKFSIGTGGGVTITQDTTHDLLINRVTGSAVSTLAGSLTANGQVFLINPNGIAINQTGVVKAAGFLASTLGLSTVPSSGPFKLDGGSGALGDITVAGKISGLGADSYVVLSGGAVTIAKGATISADYLGFSSGSAATLTLPRAKTGLGLTVTKSAKGGEINVAGSLNTANGAMIFDAGTLADAVVNIDGQVTANNSTVAITVGPDAAGSGLRVGNALASTNTTIAPGQISFTGKNHASSGLTLNKIAYTLLWNTADVLAVNSDLTGHYALANDIDFSSSAAFKNAVVGAGTGAYDGFGFGGYFNGLGHSLSNITINGDGKRALVGVFAVVSSESDKARALISNLSLDTLMVTGTSNTQNSYNIGGGTGLLKVGDLRNVFMSGAVNGPANSLTGGLVGDSSGLIDHSAVDATVQAITASTSSSQVIGGLVGYGQQSSIISNSISHGRVIGSAVSNGPGQVGNGEAGGLAGATAGQITGSHSSATVEGNRVGGLVGVLFSNARLTSSYFDGNVNGNSNSLVGGLVSINQNGVIDSSFAKSDISAGDGSIVGGLVGQQGAGTLTNSSFEGSIAVGDDSWAGGLVGFSLEGDEDTTKLPVISDNWAKATITAGDSARVGGLVGVFSRGTITSSWAQGSITAGASAKAGGLIGTLDRWAIKGYEEPTLEGGISAVKVTVGANSEIGGLAGHSSGTLSNAYATGLLTAGEGSVMGALVGAQGERGTVQNSVYLTDINGQAQLNAVGGGIRGKIGTIKNIGTLTQSELRNGISAQEYLGNDYFKYRPTSGRYGIYPELK